MAGLVVVLVLLLGVGGFVLAAYVHDARFCSSTPTFRCKVRWVGRLGQPKSRPWPRRRARAAWVHDVLLIKRGLLFPRVVALPVRVPEDDLRSATRREVPRLGGDPLVLLLRLDDDTLVELAVHRANRAHLVGPFLAAAMPGLPRGPREQPNLGR